MKFLEIEMKNFGKFHERNIQFTDGIQLIYGDNEAGKSTVHTFLRAMLFGLERGRGRAANRDTFSKYEPWENENYYAGNLRFESEEKVFCLQRNFDKYSKRADFYCETDGEVLSVENGDLENILGELSEGTFDNTLYVGQLRVATGQELSDALQNYATNYYVTGDSDIDYVAARDYLMNKKKSLEKKGKEIDLQKQQERERLEQESAYLWRDILSADEEMEKVKETIEENRKQKAEKKERQKKLAKAEGRRVRVFDEVRPEKWRIHPLEILGIILAVVLVFLFAPHPWNSYVSIVLALAGAIYIWNRMKVGKKKGSAPTEYVLDDVEEEPEPISEEKLRWEYENLKKQRLEKHIEYENVQEKLQELDERSEESKDLERQIRALALAMKRMEEVSSEMQKNLAKRLNERTSEILSNLTAGKYTRLMVDEYLQMRISHNGRFIDINQVSQGTMEQIYLALRMAAADILYDENYPIILDDTFVFYDERRLMGALRYLAKTGRQVLLFTCHRREQELMDMMGIKYHKIRL